MTDLSSYSFEKLREDHEFVVYRGMQADGGTSVLLMEVALERPLQSTVDRILHAYSLAAELDSAWAVRPLALLERRGHPALLLYDSGATYLDDALRASPSLPTRVRLAIASARALGRFHARRLIHRDIKPGNILVNVQTAVAWLTGFGLTTRVPRYRQSPEPPEIIAGTLAYMAPEQTGRMNRSIDSRSDLYSLGVTLYEMFVGALPFESSDPLDLVHCHIARLPAPPSTRQDVPAQLSALVLKLLAKTPEDRYQTAAGVEADLQRCLIDLELRGRVDVFPLGQRDVPSRLAIPERLYGREQQVAELLSAFDRVVNEGSLQCVLVSGHSGVGKSSVVNELHKALVEPHGLFASGKFDQYRRDVPYDTLIQALTSIVRQILSGSDSAIASWRISLQERVGANAQLMIDLIPELELVIGEQPPVVALPPRESQNRFHQVLERLIGAFARPDHPLTLFVDDLQWLDAATLAFLQHLLTHGTVHHLLLLGAYRDNEVDTSHPLKRMLTTISQMGVRIRHITLAALELNDVNQLVIDALHCPPDRAQSLSRTVHEKTGGNPFFTIQFLTELEEEGLLALAPDAAVWAWDDEQIRAKGYTDNVVDLMVGKFTRFPESTKSALQQLACLGHRAEFETLRLVFQDSNDDMHEHLWEAVRAGLVDRTAHAYRFVHDRVQEAAYALIPKDLRGETHLRIGMLLAEHTPPPRLEETIFDIVNQLNRASHLIAAGDRERVARLNLIAGQRAKGSTAYATAVKYLKAARAQLAETTWEHDFRLIFTVEQLLAECELLTADMDAAETRLSILARRASALHDVAVVTRLQITLYTTIDRSDLAIDVFLDYLRRAGTHWSKHPIDGDVMAEYDRVWLLLGDRRIEDIAGLPSMVNPDVRDMLDVLTEIVHPALFYDEHLSSLVVCRMVTLSLEYGNCDASCFGYVWFAMLAGPRFNNYKDGFRFGQLGYDLVETGGFTRHQARTYISFSTLLPWAQHALNARELVRRAFDVAHRTGDLTFSAYGWHVLITNYLTVGDPLAEVQTEAENALAFVTKAGFGLVSENAKAQLGLIRTLRGLTIRFGCFDDDNYHESETEAHLSSNTALVLAEFFYWTRKLQARFLAGDYEAAVAASQRAQRLLWTATSQVETGDFRFFAALAHAAAWHAASGTEREEHVDNLKGHHAQLKVWAEHCPANFDSRTALVAAEVARVEGRLLDAEHLYEAAIQSAHTNRFIHHEALANELASRFYAARGFSKIAAVYVQDAKACYLRWGAVAKTRQLEELYPQLVERKQTGDSISTMLASVEQLDLANVMRVSQAVSGEIEFDKLIDTLMRTAIEHAGAQRGVLILPRETDYRIEAEARMGIDEVTVDVRQTPVTEADLPQSLFQYVARSKETVLLHNASEEGRFAADDYVHRHRARSVLCLPLLKQTRMVGLLYLENNLTTHVFTPARMAVLKLLASEAATSLENTRLYSELREREARVRPLFNANIIGVFIWNVDGRILEANQAFGKIVGYDSNELTSGLIRWKDLMPAEWDENDDRRMEELLGTGSTRPFEAEYLKKDGSRVPVLVGAALLDGKPTEGVAFVLDLTESKAAQVKLRRNEAFLAEAQRLSLTGSFGWNVAADEHVWSEESFRIFEYDAATPITIERIRQRVHPDDLSLIDQARAHVTDGKDLDFECRLMMPTGAVKYVHIVGRGMQHKAGRQEYVGAVQDVTKQRTSEEALGTVRSELAHVARMTTLGALTASIAHEVRQPLSGIITNAGTCLRMLALDSPDIEGAQETARRIVRDGNRASEVITRLRAMFGKKDVALESMDLNEAAREVVKLSLNELKRHQAVVRLEFVDGALPITGDRVQLQQVILNLLLNAADSMAEVVDRPREIVIKTEQAEDDRVRLSVKDVGVGVAPGDLKKLFEPFYTTKRDGMGMGLSVSRSIIERHHGHIWATQNDGPGSTVAFSIPIDVAHYRRLYSANA